MTSPSGTIAGLLFGSIGISLLYVVLTRADRLSGFLEGIARALEWLSSPSAVIEFNPSLVQED